MHDFSKILQHFNEYNFFVPRPKLTNDIGRWLDHVLTWYYRPKFHINHDIYLYYGETIFLWTLSKILFESCLQTFFLKSLSFHCFSFVLQCLWGFENVSEHTNCQILEIFKMARRRRLIKLVKHRSDKLTFT